MASVIEAKTSIIHYILDYRKENIETYFKIYPVNGDILNIDCIITGTPGTIWEGGEFTLQLSFPNDFPAAPPQAKFIPPIFHPNVSQDGRLNLDFLDPKQWNKEITLTKILFSAQALLDKPNTESPSNAEANIAYVSYEKDHSNDEYVKKVKENIENAKQGSSGQKPGKVAGQGGASKSGFGLGGAPRAGFGQAGAPRAGFGQAVAQKAGFGQGSGAQGGKFGSLAGLMKNTSQEENPSDNAPGLPQKSKFGGGGVFNAPNLQVQKHEGAEQSENAPTIPNKGAFGQAALAQKAFGQQKAGVNLLMKKGGAPKMNDTMRNASQESEQSEKAPGPQKLKFGGGGVFNAPNRQVQKHEESEQSENAPTIPNKGAFGQAALAQKAFGQKVLAQKAFGQQKAGGNLFMKKGGFNLTAQEHEESSPENEPSPQNRAFGKRLNFSHTRGQNKESDDSSDQLNKPQVNLNKKEEFGSKFGQPSAQLKLASPNDDEIVRLKSENENLKSELDRLRKENEEYATKIKSLETKQQPADSSSSSQPNGLEKYDQKTINSMTVEKNTGEFGPAEFFKASHNQSYTILIFHNQSSFQKILQDHQILHNLNHPNIVRALSFCLGDKNNDPCLMLQYVPYNVGDVIGNLTDTWKSMAIFEVSRALEAAHSKGIIHRNLNPLNVLFDESGHAKVSEFGVANTIDPKEQASAVIGGLETAYFMAPELLRGNKNYDNKVDVYSFAVFAYFLISGGNLPSISPDEKIAGKLPPIPSDINSISRDLLTRCWAINPEERPSFSEIVEYIKSNKFNLINGVDKELDQINEFLSL